MSKISALTEQQLNILKLASTGQRAVYIATELQITEKTVKFHKTAIYKKLQVRNIASALLIFHEEMMNAPTKINLKIITNHYYDLKQQLIQKNIEVEQLKALLEENKTLLATQIRANKTLLPTLPTGRGA